VKANRTLRTILLLALLMSNTAMVPYTPATPLNQTIPPVWDIVADNFESGLLDAWSKSSPGDLSLLPGGGHNGTTGLSIAMGQSARYLYQSRVAYAVEGYLTFWFNPNGVALPEPSPNYWPPDSSLCVAEIRSSASDWWPPLAGFYVRKPAGQGYKGYIAWPRASGYFYDYASGQFDLADGWQKITLGYKIDTWVAVWVNDALVRQYTTDVVHDDPSGDVIELGKVNQNSSTTPSGSIHLDDVAFQVPRVDDLWVNANSGDDDNNGLTQTTAFRSIQKAADLAGPGTQVHILPGIYRETVHPVLDGSASEPAVYIAENGPGTAIIRGSEPSSTLTWTQLAANTIGLPASVDPTKIYYADLTAWELTKAPRFVVEMETPSPLPPAPSPLPSLGEGKGSGDGVGARLPLAREPDWQVTTEWKYHEFWWAANGGSTVAGCDPATNSDHNCDLASRSMTQLTDNANDTEPVGVEVGNLTTLGNLTGATIVAIDTLQGHYVYRRTITAHDVAAGRVTVDRVCEHDSNSGNPGLGWGSKYYVENHPALLDSPGEWWYDTTSKRLYLWPPTPGNPATMNIEISRRDKGFNLQNRSYTTLDGLTIEFLDGSAVYQGNWTSQKSYHNTVRHATLRYANWGVYIEQDVSADSPASNVTDGFTLEDSEIAYMDTYAIRLIDWWENSADADSFTRSGILNTVIRNNEMHHLGFRTDGDNAVGASFTFANKLRFEGNYVHHVAHNGVQFSESVIQSSKTYGFAPSEIKTGEILIKDNIFEKACQLTTDCGAIKFWGSPPDNHVFRDVLITGNIFRDTFGWTYVSEKRQRWTGGTGSQVRGLGGFGLYVDHASGIHAYRNVAYNNAYTGYMFSGVWRDGPMVYVNNVAANSLYGFAIGSSYDTHGSVDTQVINNIMVNNEAFGMTVGYAAGRYANMTIDYNLYHANGWGEMWHAGPMVVREVSGGDTSWNPYQTLAEVQVNTPWEDHGVAGDPAFWNYSLSDHDLHDGSWPDLHLTAVSVNAIDRGTTALPTSLVALLTKFGVDDWHSGTAYDIGRYEGGFALQAVPSAQAVNPGGTATYALHLDPPDLPHAVTLTVASPLPSLTVTLSSTSLAPGGSVTLTLTDSHTGTTLLPGLWYTTPITGIGGGFTQTASVHLLVGGASIYLPVVFK
jgi:hypothetical protein